MIIFDEYFQCSYFHPASDSICSYVTLYQAKSNLEIQIKWDSLGHKA